MRFLDEIINTEPTRENVIGWLRSCAAELSGKQRETIEAAAAWMEKHDVPVPGTDQVTASARALVKEYMYVQKTGKPSGQWIVPEAALKL
jgi:hypothetical protein